MLYFQELGTVLWRTRRRKGQRKWPPSREDPAYAAWWYIRVGQIIIILFCLSHKPRQLPPYPPLQSCSGHDSPLTRKMHSYNHSVSDYPQDTCTFPNSVCYNSWEPRIKDGTSTQRGRFPYMVSLRNARGVHVCGGILVHPYYVLSAAHCVVVATRGIGRFGRLRVGLYYVNDKEEDGVKGMKAVDTIPHPQFRNGRKLEYDVALLRLPEPICNIPIPRLGSVAEDPQYGDVLISLGWGGSSDGAREQPQESHQDGGYPMRGIALQMGPSIEVVDPAGCNLKQQMDHLLCLLARGSDTSNTCQGDSGGPILWPSTVGGAIKRGYPHRDVIVGITSCGEPCDKPDSYGLFSRVSALKTWVNDTIEENLAQPRPQEAKLWSNAWGSNELVFRIIVAVVLIIGAELLAIWFFQSSLRSNQDLFCLRRPAMSSSSSQQQTSYCRRSASGIFRDQSQPKCGCCGVPVRNNMDLKVKGGLEPDDFDNKAPTGTVQASDKVQHNQPSGQGVLGVADEDSVCSVEIGKVQEPSQIPPTKTVFPTAVRKWLLARASQFTSLFHCCSSGSAATVSESEEWAVTSTVSSYATPLQQGEEASCVGLNSQNHSRQPQNTLNSQDQDASVADTSSQSQDIGWVLVLYQYRDPETSEFIELIGRGSQNLGVN